MSDLTLATFITQLASELPLFQEASANAKGVYGLSLGDDLTIRIGPLEDGFCFTSALGAPPKEHCEEFFSSLMHANLLGQGTGGGILSLNEEGNSLSLSLYLPNPLTYPKFKVHIEEFINHVDVWQKKRSDAAVTLVH